MTNALKILLTVAIVLTAIGLVVAFIGFAAGGFDLAVLDTSRIETKKYDITEPFTGITADSEIYDVTVTPSADGSSTVTVNERASRPVTVAVANGILTVIEPKNNNFFANIGFFIRKIQITVSIPSGDYEYFNIETDTGDIKIDEGFNAKGVNLNTDTGDIAFKSNAAELLNISTDTGDVYLEKVNSDKIKIETETGDMILKTISAGDIESSTDTGEVDIRTVTVLRRFFAESETGDIDVSTLAAERLEIETDTGDVDLHSVNVLKMLFVETDTGDVDLELCSAESVKIKTDTGDISGRLTVEMVFVTSTRTGKVNVPKSNTGGFCDITTSTGDIEFDAPLLEK